MLYLKKKMLYIIFIRKHIFFFKMYVFFLRMFVGFRNGQRGVGRPQIHSSASISEYLYPYEVE